MATELFTFDCSNIDCVSYGRTDQIEVDTEAILVCGDCGTELRNEYTEIDPPIGGE